MSNGSPSVELYRTRSATGVINVTFRFLRDQFGPLLKGLLLLAGPPLILASTLGSFVGLQPTMPMTGGNAGLVLLQFACALIGGIIVAAVSIGALDLYHREGRASLTVRRLWGTVRTHGVALFGRQIQMGLIILLGTLPVVLLAGGLAVAGGTFAGGATLITLLFAWLAYAYPRFTMLLPGQVDAERSISVRRCVRLVRGRWGQTIGVLLLALVISMIIFSVGWIPQFLLGALQGVGVDPSGPVGPLIAGLVGGVANTLSSAVTYTALTLQYYNLVEQEDQVSLEEEVERLEQEDPVPEAETPGGRSADAPQADEEEPSFDPDDSARWQDDASGSSSH